MKTKIFYHATDNAQAILDNGFDIHAKRTRDPGDLGWGIYLTENLERAQELGPEILEVTLNIHTLAYLPYPYFVKDGEEVKPRTTLEKMYYRIVFSADRRMKTVQGPIEERTRVAKEIREAFMGYGIGGIVTPHDEGETVIFDPSVIVKVKRLTNEA